MTHGVGQRFKRKSPCALVFTGNVLPLKILPQSKGQEKEGKRGKKEEAWEGGEIKDEFHVRF